MKTNNKQYKEQTIWGASLGTKNMGKLIEGLKYGELKTIEDADTINKEKIATTNIHCKLQKVVITKTLNILTF